MDDRFNTIAGWVLGAGIVALGASIVAGEMFHSERPEQMGYPIEGVVQEGEGAAEAEKPIAAVTKLLVERFGAKPGRMALIGLSLGGYFVARAAGAPGLSEHFATVIASTPFPNPAELFALSAQAAVEANTQAAPTPAATRSRMVSLWKAGAKTPEEFVPKTAGMVADPTRVTLPFLSILGAGDSQVFARQARAWHEQIRSTRKSFVLLDAASGADGHVQVNNRLRLCQECVGWMGEIFNRSQA